MKTIAPRLLMLLLVFAYGCADSTADTSPESTETQAAQPPAANVPVPPAIETKFNKIMDEYERKISNDFWTKSDGETSFYQNAYDKYMRKKGFTPIPNTFMDYQGTVNNVAVTITEKTVSGERGGWIHQWTINVMDSSNQGVFKKQRQFNANHD